MEKNKFKEKICHVKLNDHALWKSSVSWMNFNNLSTFFAYGHLLHLVNKSKSETLLASNILIVIREAIKNRFGSSKGGYQKLGCSGS